MHGTKEGRCGMGFPRLREPLPVFFVLPHSALLFEGPLAILLAAADVLLLWRLDSRFCFH